MWNGYGLRDGTLGCAASLSNILNKGCVKVAHSASVAAVRRQLLSTRKFKEIVLRNGEGSEIDEEKLNQVSQATWCLHSCASRSRQQRPNAHCGILGEQSNIYTNDWNDGVWKQLNIRYYVRPLSIISTVRCSAITDFPRPLSCYDGSTVLAYHSRNLQR